MDRLRIRLIAYVFALALIGCWSDAANAQGTIQFLNSALSKIQICYAGAGGTPDRLEDAPVGAVVGVFYGDSPSNLQLARSTIEVTSPGLFNGGSVYRLDGNPGQLVFLKIAGWYNLGGSTPREVDGPNAPGITHYGQSATVSVALGPTAGPGTVVWQGASGTNPSRAKPFIMSVAAQCVPEPAVAMLVSVALVGLLGFRRRASASAGSE